MKKYRRRLTTVQYVPPNMSRYAVYQNPMPSIIGNRYSADDIYPQCNVSNFYYRIVWKRIGGRTKTVVAILPLFPTENTPVGQVWHHCNTVKKKVVTPYIWCPKVSIRRKKKKDLNRVEAEFMVETQSK